MKKSNKITIQIIIGDAKYGIIISDNTTANDFLSLLPLTLTLTDYAGTKKISDLPKRLNTKDAPAGYKPSAGDITYYAPWGNLAIFYKKFSYAGGLIPLGKIHSGIDAFKVTGSINVKM